MLSLLVFILFFIWRLRGLFSCWYCDSSYHLHITILMLSKVGDRGRERESNIFSDRLVSYHLTSHYITSHYITLLHITSTEASQCTWIFVTDLRCICSDITHVKRSTTLLDKLKSFHSNSNLKLRHDTTWCTRNKFYLLNTNHASYHSNIKSYTHQLWNFNSSHLWYLQLRFILFYLISYTHIHVHVHTYVRR